MHSVHRNINTVYVYILLYTDRNRTSTNRQTGMIIFEAYSVKRERHLNVKGANNSVIYAVCLVRKTEGFGGNLFQIWKPNRLS